MNKCLYINCVKIYENSNDLLNHIRVCHSFDPNFFYKCRYNSCHYDFNNFLKFQNHFKKLHMVNKTSNLFLKCDLLECAGLNFDKKVNLISHYYKHLEQKIMMRCIFKNCTFVSQSRSSYQSHLSIYHRDEAFDNIRDELKCDESAAESIYNNEYINSEELNYNEADENARVDGDVDDDSINNFYIRLFIKCKDKYLIPKYVVDEIFNDFMFLVDLNNKNLLNMIQKLKDEYEKPLENFDKFENYLLENSQLKKAHKKFKVYEQKVNWIKQSNLFVEPKEIKLNEFSNYNYVPILDNLKTLLSHQQIAEQVLKNNNDVVNSFNFDFTSSNYFKDNELYKNKPESLQIKLFIDDFNSVNPLGDCRKKYKVTGIYYKIGNLPIEMQSIDYATQLAMVFDSKLIKDVGYATVLKPLIDDLKILETEGIVINYKNDNINIKGTVSYLVADNLAANGVAGLVTCFNTNVAGYCRFCLGEKEEIQNKFCDKDFVERSLDNIQESMPYNPQLGVKEICSLDELNYFSAYKGMPPDIMHDLMEGVLCYNFGLLMEKLSKIVSVADLNKELKTFKYGRHDSKNKVPYDLFTENSKDTNYGFKLSATHMWTLTRVFPLIYGDALQNNIYYLHFIEIIDIFKRLLSDLFTENMIEIIEKDINIYLTNFKLFYPENKIIPKQHFMVHYGRAIRNFGAPKAYSTMRFESKHSYFKRVNHATHNYKNISKSLAYRHQYLQFYQLKSPNFFNIFEFGTQIILDNNLKDLIQIKLESNQIESFKWVNYKGIEYYVKDIVLFNLSFGEPEFGKIEHIFYKEEKFFLFLSRLRTIDYHKFYQAYEVEETESENPIVEIGNLKNFMPMDLYKIKSKLLIVNKINFLID